MTRTLYWVAAAVALAASLTATRPTAAQEAGGSTAGSASAQTDSASGSTSAETDTQATGQASTGTADQSSTTQSGATQGSATGSTSSDSQATQTGPALPPPDSATQTQDSATQTQDSATQTQSGASQTQQPTDQARQQNQQLNQDQPLNQDQQLDRDQALQGQPSAELDAAARGQADLRDEAMDRDLRDRNMQDRDLQNRDMRDRDFRDRDSRRRDSRDVNIGIHFGVSTGRGLMIDAIDSHSVFVNSGLRRGDLLVSVHGRPIRSEAEFVEFVQLHPAQRIPVVVLRDGRQETVYITYDERMMPQGEPYVVNRQQTGGGQAFLGVMFDAQVRDAAVVRDVTPGTPADHAGLRPGDMITGLNGQRVSSYDQAIQIIRMMRAGDQLVIDFSRRVNDQTQALLAGQPADAVRTATSPDVVYQGDLAPAPQPMYEDRPLDQGPRDFDRDPRGFDRGPAPNRPLRNRPLLPRLR